MNPISDALNALTANVQTVLGDVLVTREPSKVVPNVSASGVAVLVGPGLATERASYQSWFIEVPVSVCFAAPGEPRQMDPAYAVAQQVMDMEGFVSMEVAPIQFDQATTLPAITVILRTTTDC